MGKAGDYYRVSNSYTDEDGNSVEVNQVVYERDNGGIDYVEQTKVNGREVGHHTEHPDGTVHDYGIYDDQDDDEEEYEEEYEEDDDDEEEYEEDEYEKEDDEYESSMDDYAPEM